MERSNLTSRIHNTTIYDNILLKRNWQKSFFCWKKWRIFRWNSGESANIFSIKWLSWNIFFDEITVDEWMRQTLRWLSFFEAENIPLRFDQIQVSEFRIFLEKIYFIILVITSVMFRGFSILAFVSPKKWIMNKI